MFVRIKKVGRYEYPHLIESAREGGRHVQRVIKQLGRRDELENSGLLDGLIAVASRHSRRSIVLSSFYRGELAELRRRSLGAEQVPHQSFVDRRALEAEAVDVASGRLTMAIRSAPGLRARTGMAPGVERRLVASEAAHIVPDQ